MRIAVIPGDGVGPEVTAEAIKVLRAALGGEELALEELDWGAERYLADGTTLPEGAVEELRARYDAILAGAFGDPRLPDNRCAREILLGLRFALDLYVNLRPVKLIDPALCPLRGKAAGEIDIVCFRENTEGLYCDVGGILRRGTADEVAINEDLNTRGGVERIIRAAFEHGRRSGRRRLCMSDKSNALRFAHDLWQRVFDEVRADYPEIEAEHLYVDVLAMKLVQEPERFDLIVTCNLFGDIISDLGAGLVGGLGLAASGNIHPGRVSFFEPVHGSAPDIAGEGIVNPMASILSAGLMLEHLGRPAEAARVERAVSRCVLQGLTTPDLGGELTTAAAGDAVCEALERS